MSTGAVYAAAVLTSMGGCVFPAPDAWEDTGPEDLPCDEHWPVVIVGGGPAGLAVAGEVGGALLLEASGVLGGRYGLSSQFLVGTEEQYALGFEDSPEVAEADWPVLTGGEATADTIRFFAGTRLVYDRWRSMGFQFGVMALGNPFLREHPRTHFLVGDVGPGQALIDAVRTDVEIRLSTPAESIRVEGSRVVAVETAEATLCTPIAVVATGGYAANLEILALAAENPDGAWGGSVDTVPPRGQAILWARAGGWGIAGLEDVGWFRRSLGIPDEYGRPVEPDVSSVVPWFWTDQDGTRFVDESMTASVLLSTPYRAHAPVWGFGPRDALLASLRTDGDRRAFNAAVEAGERIVCRPDAPTVAEAVGVDPEGLATTLDEIAYVVIHGAEDSVGRFGGTFPPLSDGGWCAFLPGQVASKTYGGVTVDAHGQALDTLGAPIEGLYVVGEAAGMAAPGLGGRSGFDGSVSAALWSGWRTGAWIAAQLAEQEDSITSHAR
ncbi:MAG: FAD-binding protein [Deltaproteobacteria bacterium]|nr:FAD-binding protein [Deltaproteobacteria bacterium]